MCWVIPGKPRFNSPKRCVPWLKSHRISSFQRPAIMPTARRNSACSVLANSRSVRARSISTMGAMYHTGSKNQSYLREQYKGLNPFCQKELCIVDGSQTPPLKFEQVDYQTHFEPPKTRRATDNRRRRTRLLVILAAVVLVAGLGYGTYWYFVGRHFETTNDAYLGADSVTVAPKVAGYVTEVAVADNQRVKAGDVLVRIDPRDYQTALDSAKADLENAQATAANIDAQIKEQQATIAQGQATLAAAQAHTDVLKTQRQQADATIAAKQAALDQAKINLAQTTIAAPTDGVV